MTRDEVEKLVQRVAVAASRLGQFSATAKNPMGFAAREDAAKQEAAERRAVVDALMAAFGS